jgi:phytoene dehydrogenase-like protein
MADEPFDAVVVGAGHNGLVCGAYLARAGLKVCILERRGVIGGAAVSEEVWPGYTVSVASYVMSMLSPRVIHELELARHGFRVLLADRLFVPFPDGRSLSWYDDVGRSCAEIAKFSRHDAEAYPAFAAHLAEAAAILRALLYETPPDPSTGRWRDFKETAALLWRHRRAARSLYRMVDLMTQSIHDYLARWFESDEVIALFAYYAGLGSFAGPRTPGTAYVLLHYMTGEHGGAGGWGFVRGGMGAISGAIAAAARERGAAIRTHAAAEQILVEGGRAAGVVLASGEMVRGRITVANADARTTFLKLVEPQALPAEFLDEIRTFRTASTSFKINLALDGLPAFVAAGGGCPGYVHIGPSTDYLERAYDDAKYGAYSAKPFMTAVVPTLVDDSLAPPGHHIMSLFGGHAPYALKSASWAERKGLFYQTVLDTLSEYAPNIRSIIRHAQVLTPPDLEAMIGLPHSHVFHGELALDQLFWMRPAPGYANYRSPIAGLYQCGASTHPGGGVMGICGYNAAREILKDLRRPSGRRARGGSASGRRRR